MPYIKAEQRPVLTDLSMLLAETIMSIPAARPGLLNFVITSLINALYKDKYAEFNEALGVLECVKLELYRRRVGAYEDTKRQENGDVY